MGTLDGHCGAVQVRQLGWTRLTAQVPCYLRVDDRIPMTCGDYVAHKTAPSEELIRLPVVVTKRSTCVAIFSPPMLPLGTIPNWNSASL